MRRLREEKGASAVEFAIVASLLLMILFGIIQFGIAYNRVQGLNSAGREGARAASIGVPIDGVVSRVRSAASLFRPADLDITIDYSNDNGTSWTSVPTNCAAPCATPNTTTSCPAPCAAGSLIRVTASIPSGNNAIMQRYAIAIPLWSNWKVAWSGQGIFRVDRRG